MRTTQAHNAAVFISGELYLRSFAATPYCEYALDAPRTSRPVTAEIRLDFAHRRAKCCRFLEDGRRKARTRFSF